MENMKELCSVCRLKPTKKLTPIFTKIGDACGGSTELSKILEMVLEKKIPKKLDSKLVICTTCIDKVSESFYKGALKLNLEYLKQVFCAPDDDEEKEPNQKHGLKIIKFRIKEKRDYVNRLPLECMAEIFTYLSPVETLEMEKVCKQWKNASKIAWGSVKKLDILIAGPDYEGGDFEALKISAETAKHLLSRSGRYLQELIVHVRCSSGFNILSMINNNCENLNKIIIVTSDSILDSHFDDAFSKMKTLKKMQLTIAGNEKTLHLDFPRIVSTLPSDIESITIIHNHRDTGQLRNCKLALSRFFALKCLLFSGLKLDSNALAAISSKETLIELELHQCRYSLDARLTKKLPNLKKLKYDHELENAPNLFSSFVNCCTNLKELTLYKVIPEAVSNELKKLTQLERLNLYSPLAAKNINIMKIFAKSCPNLKHLVLDFGWRGASKFIFEDVANFKNLKYLTLRLKENTNNGHLLSTAGTYNKTLQYLDLSGCTGISNSDFQKVGNFVDLKYLDLGEIKHVDDSVILSITSKCMKLKELNLSELENISDSGLETLAQLKDLESLNIWREKKIGENIISRIVANCKKLRKLEYRKLQ